MDIAPRPARHRARWILLGVIGFILASLVAIFLEAWIGAGKTIEREVQRVAERTARFSSERASIPSLFDPVEEGNAWEPFIEGLKELDSFTGTELDVFPSLVGDEVPKIDDEALALMLVRLEPVLERLKRAFRRRDVEPRTSYEGLAAQKNPGRAGSIRLNRILADLAAHCHRWGNDREALELLAMGLWSGGIICAKGTAIDEMVRFVIGLLLKEPLKNLVKDHEATSADFHWFGEALDRLEKSLPTLSVILHREDLLMRPLFLQCARDNKIPDSISPILSPDRTWIQRHMPVRIQVARWFRWKDGIETSFDRIERLPPWERPAEAVKAFERAGDEPIPLRTETMSRTFSNSLLDRRDMTLARVAVALAAHGAEKGTYPAALEDLAPRYVARIPLDPWNGQPFRYVNRGDSAILYSLGGDGDDDGGRPVSDDTEVEEDGDVVWTIKRHGAVAK